jgi:two-component system nitrogen regulation response regulator NtrX
MISPIGNLLIVDDDIDILEILGGILLKSAITVQTASGGTEALALIKLHCIDAIITDINMPDMSGLELLFHLREMNLEVPVVFLSGYPDQEKYCEAIRLGATDFLEKPFKSEHVVGVMQKALELGVAMKQVAAEVEYLYSSNEISIEKRLQLQKVKKSVLMMKKRRQIYMKAC